MTRSNKPTQTVSVARGAVLSVAMRWSDRLIGLVSTLILVRLLVPADFGVVAMAATVVGLIDTLLDLGTHTALIQNRTPTRDDYNTAWTLRLGQAAFTATLIGFGATLAAGYFHDERVADVMRIMALAILVGGFENIGVIEFQKKMEFGRDFQFFFCRKLAGFTVTVILAFMLQSYWALVIGTLFGRIVGVGLSYKMHRFRPRVSFARLRSMWSFSQWVMVLNLGHYGLMQFGQFLVGRRNGAAILGAYSLADEIAALPTTELLAPLGRVLFPAFVNVAGDKHSLRDAFTMALGVQALLALPLGIGLALAAPDAVRLLLGDSWLTAIPLIQILVFVNLIAALYHSSRYLLLALGKIRDQAAVTWLQLALMLAATLVFFPTTDAHGIAIIRLGTAAVGLVCLFGLVLRELPLLRVADFLKQTWRPAVAVLFMGAAVHHLPLSSNMPALFRLAITVLVGATTYACAILALWRATGCVDGAEAYLLETVQLKKPILQILRVRQSPLADRRVRVA